MRDTSSTPVSIASDWLAARRFVLAALVALMSGFVALPAARAATPAETYVSENIDKGLQILKNKQISSTQRAEQFQAFLEGLTDVNRIGRFTLGAARRAASPEDVSAFDAAFRNYAAAVYQSRLAQYSGQTLKVTGSTERQPGDYVVATQLVDPAKSSDTQPLEVDFRVLNEKTRLVVVDVAIAGVWLSIEERDQFSAFLGQHNGSIPALVSHLNQLTAQYKSGNSR